MAVKKRTCRERRCKEGRCAATSLAVGSEEGAPAAGRCQSWTCRASSLHASDSSPHSSTMDITPVFNQVLAAHNASPVKPYEFRVEALDGFLKEAYRIVGHVAPLTSEHAKLTAAAHTYIEITCRPQSYTAKLSFPSTTTSAQAVWPW